MSMRRTPPLSIEGSREVFEEMSRPPADTPERRRMWGLVHQMKPLVAKVLGRHLRENPCGPEERVLLAPDDEDGGVSIRHTRPLSVEGSREVIEEMNRPPEDTPERRATFQRAAEMHRFVEAIFKSSTSTG